MGSLCHTVALVTLYATTSISSLDQNKMTNSFVKSQSTPSGCVCPTSTQSSTMSSPCMEAASNRVPSPLASTRTHMVKEFGLSMTMGHWSSCSGHAGHIREKGGIYLLKMGMLWCSEKCADYYNCYLTFTGFAKFKPITLIIENTNCIWEKLQKSLDKCNYHKNCGSPTLIRSRDVAIKWANRSYSRSLAMMQWYHNNKYPWHLRIVTCPWHLEIVTQFTQPVSRVNSHTFSADLPKPLQGWLGPPFSFIGISVLLGCSMVSFIGKRSFTDSCLLTSIPSGNTPDQTPQSLTQCPMMVIWTVSVHLNRAKSLKHRTKFVQMVHMNRTEFLQIEHRQSCPSETKSLCLTLLPMVGWSGACQSWPFTPSISAR